MDPKLALIKIITLLYCESVSTKVKTRSLALAQEVISHLKLPEQITDTDLGRSTIISLRETALWMLNEGMSATFDREHLLNRIRLNANGDGVIEDTFKIVEGFHELDEEEKIASISHLERELRRMVQSHAIKETINKAHRSLFYSMRPINYQEFILELINDLEKYSGSWDDAQEEFILNLMNMSDPDSLKRVLEQAKENSTGGGSVFKTGYHALNRMLGEANGLRRGMFVLIGALTHGYKSGLCHDLFRHACIYNSPVVSEENKIPTILYFSTENGAEEDLMRMYTRLRENETGEAVDISQVDIGFASKYISSRLQERGWHVDMLRINPGDFDFVKLAAIVTKYESAGHEIYAIFFDYLSLINKTQFKGGVIGEDIRQLMEKTRTFMSARNILFVTPHQLSQEAMTLSRTNIPNFVQEVAGKNYWDGSRRIANEADLEIYCGITMRDGKAYLEVARGKHRTVKVTPVKDRHFFLPMSEYANSGIDDDINGEDISLTDIRGSNDVIDWGDGE